jgi:hypothetical protein
MDLTWDQGIFRWLELAWLVMSWWTGFYCWRIAAKNRPVDAASKGNELFYLARRMFYKGETGFETIKEHLNAAWAVYGLLPEGYEKYYGWAHIEFLRAEMLEAAGDKKGAAQSFSQAKVYHKDADNYIKIQINGWQLHILNKRSARRHPDILGMPWPFHPIIRKRY